MRWFSSERVTSTVYSAKTSRYLRRKRRSSNSLASLKIRYLGFKMLLPISLQCSNRSLIKRLWTWEMNLRRQGKHVSSLSRIVGVWRVDSWPSSKRRMTWTLSGLKRKLIRSQTRSIDVPWDLRTQNLRLWSERASSWRRCYSWRLKSLSLASRMMKSNYHPCKKTMSHSWRSPPRLRRKLSLSTIKFCVKKSNKMIRERYMRQSCALFLNKWSMLGKRSKSTSIGYLKFNSVLSRLGKSKQSIISRSNREWGGASMSGMMLD